jgi:hypothetical protein
MAVIAVAVLLAAPAALPAADTQPAADQIIVKVVKFVSYKENAGKTMMVLSVTPKQGGSAIDLDVPNNIPGSTKLDPQTDLADVLKGLTKGAIIKVTYAGKQGRLVLSTAQKYTPKAGEDDPDAYEFVKQTETKVGDVAQQAVVLRRTEKEQTSAIAGTKDDKGAFIADEAVLAQIKKLTAGDYVDTLISSYGATHFLYGIYPYQAPAKAVFVKYAAKKEDNKSATSVELKRDGGDTAIVYVKSLPDGSADKGLLAKAMDLKADQKVLYKAVEDGGKSWLLDIRADAAAATASGDATASGWFVWNGKGGQNALTATLKATGKNEYSAVYNFKWGKADKVYKGVIKGDLKNGEVTGTGDGDGRKFGFTGTAKDGVITFKCVENPGPNPRDQGKGEMKVEVAK